MKKSAFWLVFTSVFALIVKSAIEYWCNYNFDGTIWLYVFSILVFAPLLIALNMYRLSLPKAKANIRILLGAIVALFSVAIIGNTLLFVIGSFIS